MPSKDLKKPPTDKGPRTPPPSLNRGSTLSSQPDYRAPPAPEKTAASSKAAAKAPGAPPPPTPHASVNNQPSFKPPPLQAKETKPKSKGPTIPPGSRRS